MINETFKQESLKRFNERASEKFDIGKKQHGGNLWEKKDLISMAKDEVIDQWFYLDSLEKQIKDKTIYEVSGEDIDK